VGAFSILPFGSGYCARLPPFLVAAKTPQPPDGPAGRAPIIFRTQTNFSLHPYRWSERQRKTLCLNPLKSLATAKPQPQHLLIRGHPIASRGHPKASRGHPKASRGHPKASRGHLNSPTGRANRVLTRAATKVSVAYITRRALRRTHAGGVAAGDEAAATEIVAEVGATP
jgi:hypothetical protein